MTNVNTLPTATAVGWERVAQESFLNFWEALLQKRIHNQ